MIGFTPYNSELFARAMASACDTLIARGEPVPDSMARLDIIGPRHASWGAQERVAANGQTVLLGFGEALLSIGQLAKTYAWTGSKARRFLKRHVEKGFLVRVREVGNAGTVYRIQHFDAYRSKEELPEDLLPPRPAMWQQKITMGKVVGTRVEDVSDAPF
jgi:hypothetical protein